MHRTHCQYKAGLEENSILCKDPKKCIIYFLSSCQYFSTCQSIFRISLKEVKAFLPRLNLKMPNAKLRDLFNEVDAKGRMEIGYDDFTILYNKILLDEVVSFELVCPKSV